MTAVLTLADITEHPPPFGSIVRIAPASSSCLPGIRITLTAGTARSRMITRSAWPQTAPTASTSRRTNTSRCGC